MEKIKPTDNIFAQILLEQAHLSYLNEHLEDDDILPVEMLNIEKRKTIKRINELKVKYASAIKDETETVSGKIEIEYKDIPDELRFQIYRFLNNCVIDNPGVSYKTIENTKYTKDFAK